MFLRPSRWITRPAFTLTEILVSLGIIAILAALTFTMFRAGDRAVANIERVVGEAHTLVGKKAPPVKAPDAKDQAIIANQYVVVLKPGSNATEEAQRLAGLSGAQVRHVYQGSSFRGFAVNAGDEAIEMIKADPAVAYIDQDRKIVTFAQTMPTGIRRINGDVSSAKSGDGRMNAIIAKTPIVSLSPRNIAAGTLIGGTDVTVAVIDSGIQLDHPDLYVELHKGFGFPDGSDRNGHGTHCAGIIGARDNDQGVVGVAPGCRLWALKALDAPLGAQATGSFSDVLAAVDFVAANSHLVQVCNMSLGAKAVVQSLNDAVDACVGKGVVMVVAAGNSADNTDFYSPARAPRAITVAALADSDGKTGKAGPNTSAGTDDTFATFSNWGTPVDVIAPGVDINSTYPPSTYAVLSGTSMAAPYVAGLAALMRDPDARRSSAIRNIRSRFNNPHYTPEHILNLLLSRSREVIPGRFDTRTYPLIDARDF